MKLFRDEAGQTLVFTALLMACLMGFMALAVDVSVLIRAQRKIQTAADAAAIAGTLEYHYHGSGNAAAVAKAAAANNGITDPTQVTVNLPPVNGWHTGGSYLEVIIQQPNPTIFMGTFAGLFSGASSGFDPMTVAARAVGGIVPAAACVYITAPSGQSLTVKGGASVTSPDCAWQVDSNSQQALCVTGNNANASFNTGGVLLSTGQSTQGNCNKLYPGAQTTGNTFSDPLAGLITFPQPSDVCKSDGSNTQTDATITSSTTLKTPGTSVVGGYSTSANKLTYNVLCFAATDGSGNPIPTTLSNVDWSKQDSNTLYFFENGVVLSGTNNISGTIDVNNGMFCQGSYSSSTGKCSWSSASGGPSITLTGPSGDNDAWNGMAFVMPGQNTSSYCDNSYGGPSYNNSYPNIPDACLQMQFGSGYGTITGMIYAPYAGLYIQDSGGTGIGVTNLIVGDIFINGTLTITANYNYGDPNSPLNHVALVE